MRPDEAHRIANQLADEHLKLSRLSWDIEQALFRMRIANASTGVSHRIVENSDQLQKNLDEAVQKALDYRNDVL